MRRRTLLVGIGSVIASLLLITLTPSFFTNAELKVLDLRMYFKPPDPPLGVAVIAAIDDQSIAELGRWPWPRQILAQLIDSLSRYHARIVCLDLLLSDPDRSGEPAQSPPAGPNPAVVTPNDRSLADAIQRNGSVLVGIPFKFEGQRERAQQQRGISEKAFSIPPAAYAMARLIPDRDKLRMATAYLPVLNVFANSARAIAYVNIEPDEDSIVRSQSMAIGFGDTYYVPLSLAAVAAYYGNSALIMRHGPDERLRAFVGSQQIPLDEFGGMMVRFRGAAGTFPSYSVSDIIDGKIPARALADKIVLVGATATGLGDSKATPLDISEPGVEVHATVIDDILRGDFLVRSMLGFQEIVFALTLGLAAVAVSTFLGAWLAGITEALLALAYILYAQYVLVVEHQVIGVFVPLVVAIASYFVLVFYRYVTEGKEKRRLRIAFEHYLHPEVISQVIEHPERLRLGGERRHLAIMFTDIVNFTSRAEKTPPEALVNLLNAYTTAMTDLILEGRGVVDKLMGDGIMAFWGTPIEIPNAAHAAIDCGLAMLARLNDLRLNDDRFRDLYIGIGVHAGDPIVGNFGSNRRFDYTIIGDDVNFASRLEGLTRQFKVPLLVSAETLREAGSSDYVCREIGMVKVKGKADLVSIVEVVGTKTDLLAEGGFYSSFADAMTLARAGSWQAAVTSLNRLLEQRPADHVVKLSIEKIQLNRGLNGDHLTFEFDTK